MEKNSKKISFFVERVFLIKNDVRNPKKMVSMLYDDDFGSKMAFFEDFVKCFFSTKISKIEKFKEVPLSWQYINKNGQIKQGS